MSTLFIAAQQKLGLQTQDVRVFLETDGTEIDDEDCFGVFGDGTVFVVGRVWRKDSTTSLAGANAESSDLVELIPSSYQNASSSKQGILSSLFYFKHQLNMVNSNT